MKLRSTDVVWQEVDGEAVVLDLRRSVYFRLNRSATLLLATLEDGATREELADLLVETYGIDPNQAGDEVDAFVAALEEKGLVTA